MKRKAGWRSVLMLVALVLIAVLGALRWTGSIGWNGSGPHPESPSPNPRSSLDESAREQTRPAEFEGAEEPAVLVSGIVLSGKTGRPLPGARVQVVGGREPAGTVTDVAGEWLLSLPPAREKFRPDGSPILDWTSLAVSAPHHLPRTTGFYVFPTPSPVRAPTVILCPVGPEVFGRVVAPGNVPVAGAAVLVRSVGSEDTRVKTDRVGVYGPVPVGAGPVHVSGRASGYREASREVRVPPGPGRRRVDLVFERPVYGLGIVVDEAGRPVPGAMIKEDNGEQQVATDLEGRFRWPLDRWSGADVTVSKAGYDTPEAYWELRFEGETRIVLHRESRVRGRLLHADGTPAAGCGLDYWHQEGGWGRSATTDDAGRFELAPARPGRMGLRAQLGGLQMGVVSFDVPAVGPVDIGDLVLPAALVFRRRVVDRLTGAPLAGVRVLAGVFHRRALAVTDEEGWFQVRATGEYAGECRLEREGYEGRAAKLIADGEETFSLCPVGIVSWFVVGPDDRPLPGAVAERPRAGSQHAVIARFFSDAEGRGSADLPAGEEVTLRFVHPAHDARVHSVLPVAGEVVDLGTVRLPRSGSPAELRILDAEGSPVPGATLMFEDSLDSFVADEQGLMKVMWRRADAWVRAPGRIAVKISERRSPPGTPVLLPRAVGISGRVLDPAGRGLPGIEIYVEEDELEVTDGEGEFVLPGLPAGEARILSARRPDEGSAFHEIWVRPGARDAVLRHPGTALLVLRTSRRRALTNFECWMLDRENLREDGCLVAEVAVLRGEAAIHMTVPAGRIALQWSGKDEIVRHEVKALSPGETRELNLAPGEPQVSAVFLIGPDGEPLPGEAVSEALTGVSIGKTDDSGRLVIDPDVRLCAGNLHLAIGEHVTSPVDPLGSAVIRLAEHGAVNGRVLTRARRPCANARVRLRAKFGYWHGSFRDTSEGGEFDLGDEVSPGRRVLEVQREGHLPVTREIEVHPGRTTTVTVAVPED